MLDRFLGDTGKPLLLQGILDQQCVSHNQVVADLLLGSHELLGFKANEVLIQQGASDNHIFLIVAGRVSIKVNGRELAIRQAAQHVGEMALIDGSATRSATVVALDDTVVLKVAEATFSQVCNQHPHIWRSLAKELSARLRERTQFVRTPNPRPVLFIASSAEGLPIAEQIQVGMDHAYVVPQIWTNNLFVAGHYTMEDLETRVATADFGIIVCTPDDRVIITNRGIDQSAPRDNCLVELGMCLGQLGRKRTLVVRPRGVDLKIPTDLIGITALDYVADDMPNIASYIGPVCTQIKAIVNRERTR